MIKKRNIISESYFSGTDTDETTEYIDPDWDHCIEIRHPATYLNPKWGDKNNVLRKIPLMIDYVCENSPLFENYRFVYVPDGEKEIEDINKIIETLKKEFSEYVKPEPESEYFLYYDHKITGSFKIYFNFKQGIPEDKMFNMFIHFIQNLFSLNNSKRILLNIPVFVDDDEVSGTSWLYGNIAARNIFRKLIQNDDFDTEDKKTTGYPELKWTGSDCALSSESERSLKKFKKFDFLYCRRDGALVSQEKNKDGSMNIPIAFFSHIGSDGCGRFCSLRYLSTHNTKYGAIFQTHNIQFGDFRDREFSDFTSDGAENTQILYDIMNKIAKEKGIFDMTWKSGTLKNDINEGHYPLLLACYLFRTPGTKPGQWYIPSATELMMAFSKQKNMDEKLYNLKTIYGDTVKNAVDIINNKAIELGNSTDKPGQMLQMYGSTKIWSSNLTMKQSEYIYTNLMESYSNVAKIYEKELLCEERDTRDTGICGLAFLKLKDKTK